MASKLPQQHTFLTPDTLIALGEYAKRHDIPMAAVLRLAISHGMANPGTFDRKPSAGRTERVWCYVPVEIREHLKWLGYKKSKPVARMVAAAVESFMVGLLAEEQGQPTAELKRTWRAMGDAHAARSAHA